MRTISEASFVFKQIKRFCADIYTIQLHYHHYSWNLSAIPHIIIINLLKPIS